MLKHDECQASSLMVFIYPSTHWEKALLVKKPSASETWLLSEANKHNVNQLPQPAQG